MNLIPSGNKKIAFQAISIFVLLSFGSSQMAWAQDFRPLEIPASQSTLAAPSSGDVPGGPSDEAEAALRNASTDFLWKDSPLSKSESLKEASLEQHAVLDYEYERYDFKDAVEQLRPEYASAVILKNINAENLKQLATLGFETGVIVLNGEIVLFTTGNESEIGASSAAGEILKKATFVSHVHPQDTNEEGPSSFDLNHAVDAPGVEYVMTASGAVAYNKQGIQNPDESLSLKEVSKLIEAARETARQNAEADQIAARSNLNTFIREMDLYNQLPDENRETFRRAPMPISTLAGLQTMSLTGDYYLTADIEAGGAEFQPIGMNGGGFRGTFNGNGFKIKNLKIDLPGQDYVGLFSAVEEGGRLENVKLVNVSITGQNNVGAIAGYMFLSQVNNSSVEGGTVTGLNRVGGLIGESYNGIGISNSRSNVSVLGKTTIVDDEEFDGEEIGGIVGKLWDGVVNNVVQSYALGTVTGRNQVGGLAGYSKSGDLIRSYAVGNVTGKDYVGGLVGRTIENAGILDSYYANGTVHGTTNNVGGIAGWYNSFHDGIQNTYFAGTVTSDGIAGGFLGTYEAGALSNNFWNSTLNPGLQDSTAHYVNGSFDAEVDRSGITSKDTTAMKTQSTYEGWDFSAIWIMDGYPRLRIPVGTLAELRNMQNDLNGNYYLLQDIDASKSKNLNGGAGFEPIGTDGKPFVGTFDGRGFKITGLHIDRPNENYVGLFGAVKESGRIENVKLENVSIKGNDNVGAITGYMFLSQITNSSVEGGTVSGVNRVGGLVGESYNGAGIHSSHSNVSVSGKIKVRADGTEYAEGTEIGGIVGKLWDGTLNNIVQSYALGTVRGQYSVGGLAGYSKSGDLIRSYATGNVSGEDKVGGLVGETTENAGIHDSYYADGLVSGVENNTTGLSGLNVGGIAGLYDSYHDGISNTYFAGRMVSATPGRAGGFLGAYKAGVLSNNFWDITLNPGLQDSTVHYVNDQPVGNLDLSGITSEDTTAMETQSTYAGWDFSNVWKMDGYPHLLSEPEVPVSVSVSLRNGYVVSPYASVSFHAPKGTTQMRYVYRNGNPPVETVDLGGWSTYQPGTSVFISSANVGGQDGQKTIYAQYRNAALVESEKVQVTFTADTLPPSGIVHIAGDRQDTNNPNVGIFLTAVADAVSGVDEMRVSVDGGALWTKWDVVHDGEQVELPRGEGDKEVQVELRDKAGNQIKITDMITVEDDLRVDIVADANLTFSWPFFGDVTATRTGDRYTIDQTGPSESGTGFQFVQGIDMKGSHLGFRYNVLEGSGQARLELKEKLADGTYLIHTVFSPILFDNAGSGEHEIVFPIANSPQLSNITEVVLVIDSENGLKVEVSDLDLRDSGYEPPPVSNGDILTNSALSYTLLYNDGYPSHNGEFFPENWGMTESGAYHFSGVQQGGTETQFFQNLDRLIDAAGKTLRIVYESTTGVSGSRMKLRNAKGHPDAVYEFQMYPEFEATAPGERKIVEFQIPENANWEEIDELTLYTYGEGFIDLTFAEIRLIDDSSEPVLTDPVSLIIDQNPGKIFLAPELFASNDPDKTIVDVLRNAQGRVVRIETREDIFAYYYDAEENLIKTIQAAKKDGDYVSEYEYQYTYEPAFESIGQRLKDIQEYRYETEHINAALGVTPVVSSSLQPDPDAGQSPFPAVNVTDGIGGDAGRPWIAALDDTNPTLTLDLGQFRTIDEIQVDERFLGSMTSVIYPTHFILSGSLDGVSWFDLAVYDSPEFQGGANKLYKFEFDNFQMRYVRMRGIEGVIPYWIDYAGLYPELNGFPIANPVQKRAYVAEIKVMEVQRTPVLTNIYRSEYGCLYGCEVTTGNPVAQIKKNAVTEAGEIAAPEVLLISSPAAQEGAFFLEFSVDGQTVRRQVSGAFEERNNLRIFSFENSGGAETLLPVNIIREADVKAPEGSVAVNGEADFTNHTENNSVTLSVTDSDSGISRVRFRVDGGEWLALGPGGDSWIDYASLGGQSFNQLPIPGGEAERLIEVEVEDKAGNRETFSDPVYMDNVKPPTGSIVINNGELYANNATLDLTLTGQDNGTGVDSLRLSTNGGATWNPDWTTLQSACNSVTVDGNLSTCELSFNAASLPDGDVRIFYQVRDAAGNIRQVDTFPISWSGIQGGQFVFNIQNPLGALKYDIQFSPSLTTPNWQSVLTNVPVIPNTETTTVLVPIPGGPGGFFRAAIVEDFGGAYAQSIVLDRVAPAVTLGTEILGDPAIGQRYRDVRVGLTASDAVSGLNTYRHRVIDLQNNVTGEWSDPPVEFTSGAVTLNIELPEGWGERRIEIETRDKAGNITTRTRTVDVAVSKYLTDVNYKYFLNPFDISHGVLEESHQYPHEGYNLRNYTQPTNLGFAALMLANVIAGEIVTDSLSKADAALYLRTMVENLAIDNGPSSDIDVLGLFPWMSFNGTDWVRSGEVDGRRFMLEDNANLAAALATAKGALLSVPENSNGDIALIRNSISTILAQMQPGFQCLVNKLPGANNGYLRRGILVAGTGTTVAACSNIGNSNAAFVVAGETAPDPGGAPAHHTGYGNEFRSNILFLNLQYGESVVPRSAYDKLTANIRTYTPPNPDLNTLAPDQGAFQMLWPSLTMPEVDASVLGDYLRRYVDIQLDYMSNHAPSSFAPGFTPGLLSASYDIAAGGGVTYNGNVGISQIAGNVGCCDETVASLYALGAAHMVRPAEVDSLLERIMLEEDLSGLSFEDRLVTNHGLWEGISMDTGGAYGEVVQEQIIANISTFVLGMMGTGPQQMSAYLASIGKLTTLQAITEWNPSTVRPDRVILPGAAGPNNFTFCRGCTGGIDNYRGRSYVPSPILDGRDVVRRQIQITYVQPSTAVNFELELKRNFGAFYTFTGGVFSNAQPGVSTTVTFDIPLTDASAVPALWHQDSDEITFTTLIANAFPTITAIKFVDLNSSSVLSAGGSGGGEGFQAKLAVPSTQNTQNIAKEQTAVFTSFSGFFIKAKKDTETKISSIQTRLSELKKISNKNQALLDEQNQLKQDLNKAQDVLNEVQASANKAAKYLKEMPKKGPVSQKEWDEMLASYGGIYAFLYGQKI